jgi:tetratricopeptide (TPR) repeat protein
MRRALCDNQRSLGLPDGIELIVRMGLNTGPVVVGKIGDNLRMDYTAVGDTTNLAARLQQHAEPGTILISDATARLIDGAVNLEVVAPWLPTGRTKPLAIYKVLGRATRRSRWERQDRGLSPFVGRDRELEVLNEAMADVEAGRGRVMGIVGEAGVGKSRLLYEFRRRLDVGRAAYVEGRCLSYGSAMPFVPVQDIVRSHCGISENETPSAIADRVRDALAALGMSPDEGAPYLLQLLGNKEGTERLATIGPETVKARIFSTALQMTVGTSQRRPLVLAVEDLQWIDKTSEKYLDTVVDAVAEAPMLFVATYRPGYDPSWLDRPHAMRIVVTPLAAAYSRSIVVGVMRQAELGDAVVDSIVSKADGNPFFLEELTRVLIEHHTDTYTALPETIQGVLQARIDRLPDDYKRVLQTAAVLGREFSEALLRATWDGRGDTVEPALGALTQQELLHARPGAGDTVYVFKHALTRDVAYDGLLTARRQRLHERAGSAFEGMHAGRLQQYYEVLAHHYSHSANTDKALTYLEGANTKAAKANALLEAKGYFDDARRILERLPNGEATKRLTLRWLLNQYPVFFLLYEIEQYQDLLTRHESLALEVGDAGLLGRFYTHLGLCQWFFGPFARALDTAVKAPALSEFAGDGEGLAEAHTLVEWCHYGLSNFAAVGSLRAQTRSAFATVASPRLHAWTSAGAALALMWQGRWNEAEDEAACGLRESEEFSDDSAISFSAWTYAMVCIQKGDLQRAKSLAERGVAAACTPANRLWAQGILGWVWARTGDPQRAAATLVPIVAVMQAARYAADISALILGEAYVAMGAYELAHQTLEAEVARTSALGTRHIVGSAYRWLAETAARSMRSSDDFGAAVAYFRRSIDVLREIGAENELALAYAGYGRLLGMQPDHRGEARDCLARALEILERLGTLDEPDKVRRDLAHLDH